MRTRRRSRMLVVFFCLAVGYDIDGIAFAGGSVDVTGDWEIQEEERSYIATLDANGNGSYTWQSGRIVTTSMTEDRWEGLWTQAGNDREGGFEVKLSSDRTQAEGKWWYTRVGQQIIPPKEWGGPYTWKRLTPVPPSSNPR